ncbi:MAG: hypothetical protein Q7T77_04855 [Sulfuricurvum sp.]|nr:hypothetical protein [Sulfuricurvum sp.]
MSAAKNSLGTVFSVETIVAGTYIAIEEIIDIPGILGDKTGKIDVTSIDSVGYKEYINDALRDAPEVSFKCNFTNGAGQLRVKTLADSGANTSFKLVLPNKVTPATGTGTTIVRQGYISARSITSGKGSQLMLEFTVQFSGAPIETVAS